MKKTLFILMLLVPFILAVQSGQAAQPEMDADMLKCLLSGICPGDEAVIRPAGTITAIEGDVEYSSDLGLNFQPLTEGETVKTSYRITTGFESYVTIDFGFGEIRVPPMTQFSIEKFENAEQLRQIQVVLTVGHISARVTRPDSIRSDFSVRTTPSISSIRGSEMQVEVMKDLTVVTSAVDGTAYVKGIKDTAEKTIAEGYSVTTSAEGKAGQPVKTPSGQVKNVNAPIVNVNTSALANVSNGAGLNVDQSAPGNQKKSSSLWLYLVGGLAIVALVSGIAFAMRKNKR